MIDDEYDPLSETLGGRRRLASMRRNFVGRGFMLELYEQEGHKIFVPKQSLSFSQEIEPNIYDVTTTGGVGLGEKAAQQVMEDLWAAGVRPKAWRGDASDHVADLREEVCFLRGLVRDLSLALRQQLEEPR